MKEPFGFKLAPWVLTLAWILVSTVSIARAQEDWKQITEAAKKEGKVVVGGPPTGNLRQKFQETFEKRSSLNLELVSAPGPQNASRAAAESKAGVRYFDVLHAGSGTLEPLMYDNLLAPFSDYMILPEVKDPRQWWGGHLWEDNLKTNRFIYSFSADFSTPPFYNSDLVKPPDLASYDDLLNPKWKGKIGFFDPRVPSAGQGLWGFLMKSKGKEFLQKLAEQNLFVSRDGKQLADALAKGTLAVALGVSQRFVEPYIKSGLPIKPLMTIKEGMGGSNGFGTVAVLKNPAHPNATKVYVNWLLGKEGQDLYGLRAKSRHVPNGCSTRDRPREIRFSSSKGRHDTRGLREGSLLRRRHHYPLAGARGRLRQEDFAVI